MSREINLIITLLDEDPDKCEIVSNRKLKQIESSVRKIELETKLGCKKCNEPIKLNLFWTRKGNLDVLEADVEIKLEEPRVLEETVEILCKPEPKDIVWQDDVSCDFDNRSYKAEEEEDPSENENISEKSAPLVATKPTKQWTPRLKITKEQIDEYISLLDLPKSIVLPDLLKLKIPSNKSYEQPDGSTIFLKKSIDDLWVLNFNPREKTCDLCGRTHLHGRTTLIDHRRDEHLFGNNSKTCHGCGRLCENERLRTIHTHFCLKAKSIPVNYCRKCDFQASNHKAYRRHMREKHNAEGIEKNFVCHICSAAFEFKRVFQNHLHRHKDPKPYKCAHCDISFKAKPGVNTHLIKIHFHSLAKEVCKICDPPIYFLNDYTFRDHMNLSHIIGSANLREPCPECGKMVRNVKQHCKEVHIDRKSADTKTFLCPICQKVFYAKNNLRGHMTVHKTSDEMKHKCGYCERAFDTPSSLVRHERGHTGEKPYKCDVCGKAYPRSQSLIYHKKIHTGQTFDCHICKAQIRDPRNLQRHLKRHEAQMGVKLTLTKEEHRLAKLNLLKPDELLGSRT